MANSIYYDRSKPRGHTPSKEVFVFAEAHPAELRNPKFCNTEKRWEILIPASLREALHALVNDHEFLRKGDAK